MVTENLGLVPIRPHGVFLGEDAFKKEILQGLLAHSKRISCKWLYDEEGSRLFGEICKLPEYYLTRVENELLETIGKEKRPLAGTIVEYGSGSCEKVRPLLGGVKAYVAIDIAENTLIKAALALAQSYKGLQVLPVVGDIAKPIPLCSLQKPLPKPWVIFYAGSSIGNFSPQEACRLLGMMKGNLSSGDGILIGFDLQKPASILERAYDDPKGVTARFNKNLLKRIAKAFGVEIALESFKHLAHYNAREGRIEIHLECLKDQTWELCPGVLVRLQKGEKIHTENSYKYTLKGFKALLESAGFYPQKTWTDKSGLFAVVYADVP